MAYKITLVSIILIILSSLVSNIVTLYTCSETFLEFSKHSGNDFVSIFETRIDCVKKEVPKIGIIGYVSDRPPIEFVLANYILSPLILEVKQYDHPPHFVKDKGKNFELVIENSNNIKSSIFKNRGNYAKVLDCSNGVRLFSHRKIRK
jgi:hypothetical protein